jgi:lipooligosaccharide transport system permease protein
MLIGFAFAAVGMAATTFMRAWTDFDYIAMVTLPLFLFSATFYPISAYPPALQTIVQLTPLYHGVDLLRSLTTGVVGPGLLVHVAYLAVMGVAGLLVVSRRLDKLLLK